MSNRDKFGLAAVEAMLVCALAPMDPHHPVDALNPAYPIGIPLVFTGVPGVGKSATVRTLCQLLNMPFADLNFGRIMEESLTGLPMMDGKGGATYACIEPELRSIYEVGEGIVLLDEVNMGDEAMWKHLQDALSTGRVGGLKMGRRVRFVAVRNPRGSATAHRDFPIPVANRFVHMDWPKPDNHIYAAWRNGFLNEAYVSMLRDAAGTRDDLFKVTHFESKIAREWNKHNPSWSARISGYLRAFPGDLHAEPVPGSAEADGAWPSPRTWYMLESLMTTCEILGFSKLSLELMTGTVGATVATKFSAWVRDNDIPDPELLLSGKVDYKFDPSRLDRNLAVYMACARYLANIPAEDLQARNEMGARAWGMLGEGCSKGAADIATEPATLLAKNGYAILDTNPATAALAKAADKTLSMLKHVSR